MATTTTITDKITEELLAAVDDQAALDAVFEQYGQSKGPFYHALAQATVSLQERLASLSHKAGEAQKQCLERQQKVQALEEKHASLDKSLVEKGKELISIEAKLKEKQGLLDQAKALAGLGFGPEHLSQLHDRLAKLAAVQGMKPVDSTKLFFELVAQYEDIVSLGNEAKRAQVAAGKAKAEAEKAQAEARAVEAKTKARKVSIDFAEKLLAQGVKEADLPQWMRILAGARISPESLAQALEAYGSLEKLRLDREKRRKELALEIKKRKAEVEALIEERETLSAAIGAVREKAVTEIAVAGAKAVQNVNALMAQTARYAEIERKAGAIEQQMLLAKAFTTDDLETWKRISRKVVQDLISGLVVWCQSDMSRNPSMKIPGYLSSKVYSYAFSDLRLRDLLTWALIGVYTPEELKALSSGS